MAVRQQIEITEPLYNQPELKDVKIVARWETFQSVGGRMGFAVYDGSGNVTAPKIQNVEICTDQERFNPNWTKGWKPENGENGIPQNMAGIRTQGEGIVGMSIKECYIHNVPDGALDTFGTSGLRIENFKSRQTYSGINFENPAPTQDVQILNADCDYTWIHPDRLSDDQLDWARSEQYPGQWMGGDGFALGMSHGAMFENLTSGKEVYLGCKFGPNCKNVILRGLVSDGFMLQGANSEQDLAWSHENMLIEQAHLSKMRKPRDDGKNQIQISLNVCTPEVPVLFTDCTIDGGRYNGNGTQLYWNTHARFQGCRFFGHRGTRGSNEAVEIQVYERDGTPESSVNNDIRQVNFIE